MKLIKRLFSFLLFLLVVVIVGIIAIPFLYKDKVTSFVKDEANKSLNAKIDFEDVDISLLRSFPDLNVRLENVTVDGVAAFEGVRLFKATGTEVELNVLDAFAAKDNFPIKSFELNQPVINLLVLKDGQANWDIVKPTPTQSIEEETNFFVKMKQYTIENGTLTYEDRSLDMKMAAKDLNHSGSGQFASDNFDLATITHISNLDVEYEGIDYLSDATANLDAMISMDVPNLKFTLKDNELLLNALKINTAGTLDVNGDDYLMDLSFNSPQGDFKSLWSLIPGVFTEDYAQAAINGKMGFNGFLKGTYSAAQNRFPAFQIKADVDNGNVKYPDLPIGVAGIFTNIKIENSSSDFDKLTVDIPQFKMKVGDNPVTAAFNLSTPLSDPTVKGNLKGIINLEEIGRAVPIEGITELKGIVKSDIVFNASQSQLDQEQYEQVNIAGTMNMDNVSIQQTGTPPIVINNLTTDFSPQMVKVESFNAKMGESDIQASGQINNILAYFSSDKTMEGTINYSSNYLNVNEWVSEPVAESAPATTDSVAVPFDRFNFNVNGSINKMDYDTYQLTNIKTKGKISPNESTIDNFSMVIGKSDIQASGKVVNLMDYVMENEVLTGEIQLKSKYLDLNQFMVEEEATDTTAAIAVVPVPERVDLILHTDIKKVTYTNFDIKNIKGFMEIKEEVAKMEDIKGKILGGDIEFGGSYNTQNMNTPKFSLDYNLEKLDFNNAFKTFNTFQLLAPLGKYIDGRFTSNLKMSGTLGKDLIPNISSLNLSGFLHTFGATIRESKTFKKLSEKLQIKALENIKLQDSKNWLTIKDGYVDFQEATHNIGNDISLKIKGKHHILQEDLNYLIEATVPKSEINRTGVGQVANQGWDLLTKEAQKRGVDIDNGDMVKFNINLTGSLANPSFKIIPVGTDGSVTFEDKAKEIVKATVDKAVDSAKTVVNQKVDSVKTVLTEVKDSLKVVVDEKKDQVLDKGKEEAGKILDSVLVGKNPLEIGKDQLKDLPSLDSLLSKDSIKVKDKVKDVLKDFNPFKKKKKGNK